MSLQGRRHRSRVQSMRQGISAKRISYRPLHQGTPSLLLRYAPWLWVPRPRRPRGRQLCRLSDSYQENHHAQVLLHGLRLLGDHQGSRPFQWPRVVTIPRGGGESLQEAIEENQRRTRPPIPPRSNDFFVDSDPTIGLRMSSGNLYFFYTQFDHPLNCKVDNLGVKSVTIHQINCYLFCSWSPANLIWCWTRWRTLRRAVARHKTGGIARDWFWTRERRCWSGGVTGDVEWKSSKRRPANTAIEMATVIEDRKTDLLKKHQIYVHNTYHSCITFSNEPCQIVFRAVFSIHFLCHAIIQFLPPSLPHK